MDRFKGFIMVDMETTGLFPAHGFPLEIGMAHYDKDFNLVDIFHSLILDQATYEFIHKEWKKDDYARGMHERSGLLADLMSIDPSPLTSPEHVSELAVNWLAAQNIVSDIKIPYSGSSVHFDMGWVTHHMPKLADRFGYRTIDASSFREYAYVRDEAIGQKVDKEVSPRKSHRVMDDIMDSIDLLKALQKHGVIM